MASALQLAYPEPAISCASSISNRRGAQFWRLTFSRWWPASLGAKRVQDLARQGSRARTGIDYMRPTLILFILLSVLLSSGSQILLKFGMTRPEVKLALAGGLEPMRILIAIASSPAVFIGLACFGLSAVVWLFVLAKIPLSSAYPFVALGIAVTVAAGRFMFGETVSVTKFIGVALVIAGVLAVSASG
jgi:multidrug transporter EmrE-like cation transporter